MSAILLDRDGVINKYPGDTKYVTRWSDFHFLPGVRLAIAKLHKAGFGIFLISNQGGVGKGLFSQKTLDSITAKMLTEIQRCGGKISGVYYCTHRKEDNCFCRKPRAGLVHTAKREHSLDLKKSIFIGDTIRDVLTAQAVGCQSILVLSGKEKLSNRKNWQAKPDFIFKDLAQAAKFILKER
jgi:histidinol-phosphate phosphatase family protein